MKKARSRGYLGGKEIPKGGKGIKKAKQRKPVCPLIWKTGKLLITIL